jgi:hypothetical protein
LFEHAHKTRRIFFCVLLILRVLTRSFHQQKQDKIVRLNSSGSFSGEAQMTIISRTIEHTEILRVHKLLKKKENVFLAFF